MGTLTLNHDEIFRNWSPLHVEKCVLPRRTSFSVRENQTPNVPPLEEINLRPRGCASPGWQAIWGPTITHTGIDSTFLYLRPYKKALPYIQAHAWTCKKYYKMLFRTHPSARFDTNVQAPCRRDERIREQLTFKETYSSDTVIINTADAARFINVETNLSKFICKNARKI